jgi:hypothetical protein
MPNSGENLKLIAEESNIDLAIDMKLTLLLFLYLQITSSCSTRRENTYEENLAICTKKLGHFPKGADSTGLAGAQAESNFKQQIRECMKGSFGPDHMVKTYRGDSVSTAPTQGKAMVLFFWTVPDSSAPVELKKSNLASLAGINSLCRKYHGSVDFLGFPFNDSLTTTHYLQKYPLDFPQVNDKKLDNNRQLLLTQNILPYVIFISTQGRVIKMNHGGFTTETKTVERYSPIIQACIDNKSYNE